MESVGVLKLLQRPIQNYAVWHTTWELWEVHHGSKAKPYGDSVAVEKLEYVGHVLNRKLHKDTKENNYSNGKSVTKQSYLTEADQFQQLY
jgi:hypothetical protein